MGDVLEVLSVTGRTVRVRFSNEALRELQLEFQCMVDTSKGSGRVMGVTAANLYVVLDKDADSGVATPLALADLRSGALTVVRLPDEDPEVAAAAAAAAAAESEAAHRLKRIVFCGRAATLATQRNNGPCPVLAIANALALRGALDVAPGGGGSVTPARLCAALVDYARAEPPPAPPRTLPRDGAPPAGRRRATLRDVAENSVFRRQLRDELLGTRERGLALLERLYAGMDVDPIFSGVEDFDLRGDSLHAALFPLCGVRLLHGWVADRDGPFGALADLSFNDVTFAASLSPRARGEGGGDSGGGAGETGGDGGSAAAGDTAFSDETVAAAQLFLGETFASQMTPTGRALLQDAIAEDEVVVLFWRNHFFTATKKGGRLLVLCSDENFNDKPSFVFAIVTDNVRNEEGFTDADGVVCDPTVAAVHAVAGDAYSAAQILSARDALLADAPPDAAPSVIAPEVILSYLDAQQQQRRREAQQAAEAAAAQRPAAPPPPLITAGPASGAAATAANVPQHHHHHRHSQESPAAGGGGAPSAAAAHAEPTDDLVNEFLQVVPQADRKTAVRFLRQSRGRLDAALSQYFNAVGSP